MSYFKKTITRYQLISFFVLNFLITWFFFFLPGLTGTTDLHIVLLVSAIGGAGPAIAAVMLSALLKPERVKARSAKKHLVFATVLIAVTFLIMLYLDFSFSNSSLIILFLVIVNAAIAAYIVSGGLSSVRGVRELLKKLYYSRASVRWYAIAFLLPPAIYFLATVFGVIKTGSPISMIFPQLSLNTVFWTVVTYLYIGVIRGPLREEIGWRGFALPRMQYYFSPLVATFILAVIWTLWHLPLYVNGMYPGGIAAILDRFYWNIPITFLFTWIYNRTRGSLLLTTLFHTTINTCGTMLVFSETIAGPLSTAFIVLLNAAAIAVIITNRMWVKLPRESEVVYNF